MRHLARFAIAGLALSATGAAAPARGGWTVHSAIRDYRFTQSTGLVRIARATDSEGYCDRWGVIKAKTVAGRQAEARGWRVTREARLGPLAAVSVIRRFEGAPGATCVPINGNVVIYQNAQVIGILYAEKDAKVAASPKSFGACRRAGAFASSAIVRRRGGSWS